MAVPTNNPTDSSLMAVLADLDRAGWAGQFMALEGGDVRCLTCRGEFPASTIEADEARRLEGASDPADMLIVVPLTCPHCATKGVLVAALRCRRVARGRRRGGRHVSHASRRPRHRPPAGPHLLSQRRQSRPPIQALTSLGPWQHRFSSSLVPPGQERRR